MERNKSNPGQMCWSRNGKSYDVWWNVPFHETESMGLQPDFSKGHHEKVHPDVVIIFLEAMNGMIGRFLTPLGPGYVYFHDLQEFG